ncbi:MAG: phage tail tape measure protein [Armatimonadota bacterium]
MNDLGLGIIVSLKDAFTQNASRIQSSMESLDSSVAKASENMTRSLGLIEKGTMMVGAGLALLAVPAVLVASTLATQKALGELASVGVKDFRAMEDAAEAFTNQWAGASKAEFIGAAYDVKSALANLSDTAVGTFAAMAAITGKATKATTQEMVETFTTAYGIFKPLAKEMPDMEWAKMFSGALAQTVGVFKTTGPQMAEAIKNIGAIAAASNVPLQEQMAILGQLQTTMPGSEAGTLYKAFMMKVAEAGDDLGLSFVDAGGRLKGILPILQEVKRQFPDLSQAAAQVKLKKAFGSDEAVRFLLQMSMGMEQLDGNIRSVGDAMKGGTAVTLQMANAMNMDIGSQFTLVKQQLQNLAEILGRTLLPVVIPVFQGISRCVLRLEDMAKAAPGVTRAVLTLCVSLGAVLVIVGSVTAAIGTIGVVMPAVQAGIAALGPILAGVGAAVSAYFWPVVAVIAAVAIAVVALRKGWETNFGGIRDVVLGAWSKVSLAVQGIRSLISSLSAGSGQISAELAGKLQSAGLMGFVTTVFQVYYRVREFLSGLWQAFSSVFGKIRQVLEPAIRSVLGAFSELGRALLSVTGIFTKTAASVDSSTLRTLGQALGKILGVLLEVGAYLLKFFITRLVFIIKVVGVVVRAVVWLGQTITQAFVTAAPYVTEFYLPLRLLTQSFRAVGRVAASVWQMMTGQVSVVGGLKLVRDAITEYLVTPFKWLRDAASGAWQLLSGLFTSMGALFKSLGSALLGALVSLLPSVVSALRSVWTGILTAFSAGWNAVATIGAGAFSMVAPPFTWICDAATSAWAQVTATAATAWRALQAMASAATGWLRAPFISLASFASSAWSSVCSASSIAFSRVLSGLRGLVAGAFESGRALMNTIASGIRSAVSAPYDTLRLALLRLRKLLPFSDAKEGPLSTLTRSGTALLETFSSGINRASQLPSLALKQAFAHMNSAVLPSALAGTLALTPLLTGAMPEPVLPVTSGQSIARSNQSSGQTEQSRLLFLTRGTGGSAQTPEAGGPLQDVRPLLEAILAKLDGATDRPIDVTVTTQLDGRKIAHAVYKDMRERKVRNYE